MTTHPKPKKFYKDPAAILDYSIDWSSWLPSGDTIQLSSWQAEIGITIDSNSFDASSTTVWLSGGTVGNKYLVTNTITTVGARTEQRSILLVLVEK